MTREGGPIWRDNVREEILTWASDVLSVPSEHFSGLAPCPFSKKCVSDSRVDIQFGNERVVLDACDSWDDDYDLVIIVPEGWDYSLITSWCEHENERLAGRDLTLMAFVPGEGPGTGQPSEEGDDWDYLVEDEYPMVFVQRLSKVNDASALLDRHGYYRNCSAEFLEYVSSRRGRTLTHARKQEDHA